MGNATCEPGAIKKKIEAQLKTYFPAEFKGNHIALNAAKLREIAARYGEILGEQNAQTVAQKAEYEQHRLTASNVWNVYVEGNAEIQAEVGFEEFLFEVGQHTRRDVGSMSVFEFYTFVTYLKNKQQHGNN